MTVFENRQSTLQKLPRMASIQNPYNLLNRTFEIGLAEVSLRENCGLSGLLPYGIRRTQWQVPDGQPTLPYARLEPATPPLARYNGSKAVEATTLLCGTGQPPRHLPRCHGPAICHHPSLCDGQYHRCHHPPTVAGQYRQHRFGTLPPELIAEIEGVHKNNPQPQRRSGLNVGKKFPLRLFWYNGEP